jgi:hypothetical protein
MQMPPDKATPTPGTAAAGTAGDATAKTAEQRLEFLFRHSLRAGRVHVLQHPMRRYRGGGES